MNINKINFRQPKYIIPMLTFLPLVFFGYITNDILSFEAENHNTATKKELYALKDDSLPKAKFGKIYDLDKIVEKKETASIKKDSTLKKKTVRPANKKLLSKIKKYNNRIERLEERKEKLEMQILMIEAEQKILERKARRLKGDLPDQKEKNCQQTDSTQKSLCRDVKTWAGNAGHFFGDIFTKGAVRVYTNETQQ